MKTQLTHNIARSTALAVGVGCLMTTSLTFAADAAKKEDKGFLDKMEQWQDKMSDKFRDTWKNLRGESKEKSFATASVDLREDKDNYTLRLNLPDRDLQKVDIKLEGDTLRIVAPAGDKAGRYEQTLALAGAHLAAHNSLDTVRNDISRLKGETHAISAH